VLSVAAVTTITGFVKSARGALAAVGAGLGKCVCWLSPGMKARPQLDAGKKAETTCKTAAELPAAS